MPLQEELKAHLEAQLKHQQIQLRMNRKGGGQNSCQSSQPEIRIQTSVGQGNSVVITTTAPPSSSSKSSHSPTIITMTKSANNKAISLLASTKTQEPLTTSVHSVAAVHPKPKGFSRLEMSNGTTITPSLANKDNCQDELHTHFTNNSVIHQNGPKERKLVAKFRTLEAESSEDESSEDSMGETGKSL